LAALTAKGYQAPDDVQGNGVRSLALKDLRLNFPGQILTHRIAKGGLIVIKVEGHQGLNGKVLDGHQASGDA
jgi:hypothetical protein